MTASGANLFDTSGTWPAPLWRDMRGITGGFGSTGGGDDRDGRYDRFEPDLEPEAGAFLAEQDVLVGRDHAVTHRLARLLFERRGVYDVTFGYNLARLNLDARHPEAGFRYAQDADEPAILLAAFTPTTEFCPQSDALTAGAFRAWNGEPDAHEYDLVRVRVAPMHQDAKSINERLRALETSFEETGQLRADIAPDGYDAEVPTERGSESPF